MEAREFGEYLRNLRKSRKLTIRQLDTYSGVSHSYISQMERGERGVPSPEILKKLAGPLQIPHVELMYAAGHVDEAEDMTNEMAAITLSINVLGELTELIKKYTDDEIISTYRNVYKSEDLSEEQVRKILSYVRFVLLTEQK